MRSNSSKALNNNIKSPSNDNPGQKKSCLSEIQRLQRERDERRKLMEEKRQERAMEDQRNRENGTPGDVDFQRMIKLYRKNDAPQEQQHIQPGEMKICICIRKRPISNKEIKRFDYDSVTCINPLVVVHDCKLKVDGISKYLSNESFEFDHTFHEEDETIDLYRFAVQPLIEFVMNGGRGTVFAYGQTGSGKTYTMQGIQGFVAEDLFAEIARYESLTNQEIYVYVSYFEIYGGRCQDLLNSRNRLNVREDGNGEVVVSDLVEIQAGDNATLNNIIETGNRNRTTHATESNDESSRSHAICQIVLKTIDHKHSVDTLLGRLSLIDLAGSERGADTKSHNRQRRMEGAEINKSLLALKECVRALDTNSSHVPYRASKLTLVLKDSFTNKKSRTVMIAAVSPAASSADHTINTLRYADRIKERVVGGQAARNAQLLQNVADANNGRPSLGNGRGAAEEDSGSNKGKASAAAAGQPPRRQSLGKDSSASNLNNRPVSSQAPAKQPVLSNPQHSQHDHKQSRAAPSNSHNNNRQQQQSNGRNKRYEDEDLDDDDFNDNEEEETEAVNAFHKTVQDLFDEEEDLLNLHMSVIQENAELLTEEGKLLQQIQADNHDIDAYAARLEVILKRKEELIAVMKEKVEHFRLSLQQEEMYSKKLANRKTPY